MTVIVASSQDADSRELRLAVVMTGGVSLAVWIGGVAGEIYRAAQGAGLYGALGQLTQTEVVVDVITGASAGGVNGAFLHTALSRELEPDRFNGLRGVWLEDGAFTKLFRPVKDRQPPSLLQGDEYFLGCLERELLAWADVKGVLRGKSAEGLRLVMTTTPLDAVDNLRLAATRRGDAGHRGGRRHAA